MIKGGSNRMVTSELEGGILQAFAEWVKLDYAVFSK